MKQSIKRLAAVAMSLLLAGMARPAPAYGAAPALSASADKGSAAKGEAVTVSIQLSNNPSLSTLGMALGYDSSVLTYESTSWSGGLSANDMKMASDTGGEVNLSIVCGESYLADGTIASVRFVAAADTDAIPVTLSLRDMADAELSAVYDCSVSANVKTPASAGTDKDSDKNSDKDSDKNTTTSGNGQGKDEAGQKKPDKTEPDKAGTDTSDKNGSANNANTGEDGSSANINNGGASSAGTAGTASTGVDTNGVSGNSGAGSSGDSAGFRTQQVTVSTQTNQAQGGSSQGVQSASNSGAGSAGVDQNYKTGAGMGNDSLLIIASACGIAALAILLRRAKKEKEVR